MRDELGPSGVLEPLVGVCGGAGEPSRRLGGKVSAAEGGAGLVGESTSIAGLFVVGSACRVSTGVRVVLTLFRGVALRLFSGPVGPVGSSPGRRVSGVMGGY